jgi:hypothetical protein
MTVTIERIGALLKSIGASMGTDLSLDSSGVAPMTYDGGRQCVFAAQGGFRPRIGMAAPLIFSPSKAQMSRALALNANLERETGVLALDDSGAIGLTAARDAEGLNEETLAAFMASFLGQAADLAVALQGVGVSSEAARPPFGASSGEGLIRG